MRMTSPPAARSASAGTACATESTASHGEKEIGGSLVHPLFHSEFDWH
jgi:hypothetical protein